MLSKTFQRVGAALACAGLLASPMAAMASDKDGGHDDHGSASQPKTHWKMIYDENTTTKNFVVEVDVCDTALMFSGTNKIHNHLYQKFLGDQAQNDYHILFDNTYEGKGTANVDGDTEKLTLHRENSDHGFYSLANDVEDFSSDKGLFDDTIRINKEGGVLLLNFAKSVDLQPTQSKFVANCVKL